MSSRPGRCPVSHFLQHAARAPSRAGWPARYRPACPACSRTTPPTEIVPEPPPPEGPGLFGDVLPTQVPPPVHAPAYRVLARKYRPTRFDDLIGQEAMVRTLRNAFALTGWRTPSC